MYKKILFCFIIIVSVCLPFTKVNIRAENTQPRIVVVDYSVSESGLIPGELSEVTITFKNMNPSVSVYSILMTYQLSSDQIYTEYGFSNQVYIEEIGPDEEKEVTLLLRAKDTLVDETVTCSIELSFINAEEEEETEEFSSFMVINLPVSQEFLKIERVYIPQTATLNSKTRVSVTYTNINSEEIYNVQMRLNGAGFEEKWIDVGTILNASSKNQEIYLEFDRLGEQSINIDFLFEDVEGNILKTRAQTYDINILEQEVNEEAVVALDEPLLTQQRMMYMIGLIVSASLGLVLIISKLKRR